MEVRDFAMELMKLKGGMKKVKENGIGCVRVERACGEDEVLGFFSLCLLGEFARGFFLSLTKEGIRVLRYLPLFSHLQSNPTT